MFGAQAELTPEQTAIVQAGKNERIVVEAGAGTGKTFTLVERLRWLIKEQGCRAAGILVISFSRAVVHSIQLRTRDAGLASLDIRTFDSFALEMAPSDAPDSGTVPDFDRQVDAATTAILNDATAQELIHDFEHVLVDEAQDVVAPRSGMVRALLSELRCGFTIFGDRAQAIYGFAAEGSGPDCEDDLLSWASKLPEVTACRLSRTFRAKGKWPLEAARLQNAVRSRPESVYDDLVSLTYRLPVVTSLTALIPFIDRSPGRVAFLCRTNGDTLVLSLQLDSAGIVHTLRRSAHERFAPKWLAQAVAGVASPLIDVDDLGRRVSDVLPPGTIGAERILDLLRRIGRSGQRKIDLRKVAERVQRGTLSPLLVQERERVVVSTIHRAKGLEFEHVVLAAGDWIENEKEANAEAARLLFVALTRAQHEIFLLRTKLGRTTKAKGRLANRWAITSFRGRSPWISALEFRTTDLDMTWPALLTADDFAANQRHLSERVNLGDTVDLMRVKLGSNIPFFSIEHQGACIGRTSEAWGAALLSAVDNDLRRVPKRVDGLRIDRIVTTANPALARGGGPSMSSLYLQVWLRGLAITGVESRQ